MAPESSLAAPAVFNIPMPQPDLLPTCVARPTFGGRTLFIHILSCLWTHLSHLSSPATLYGDPSLSPAETPLDQLPSAVCPVAMDGGVVLESSPAGSVGSNLPRLETDLPPTCVARPNTGGTAPYPPSSVLQQPQPHLELPLESPQPPKQPLHQPDRDPSLPPADIPLDQSPPAVCPAVKDGDLPPSCLARPSTGGPAPFPPFSVLHQHQSHLLLTPPNALSSLPNTHR